MGIKLKKKKNLTVATLAALMTLQISHVTPSW